MECKNCSQVKEIVFQNWTMKNKKGYLEWMKIVIYHQINAENH